VDDVEARVERFRDAFFALDAATVRDGIGRLPKALSAPLHTAAGTPFPALGRLPDPRTALRRVRDLPMLVAVAEACAQECLDVELELLGDSADDPTVEELRATLPTLQERFEPPIVRVMFTSIAISNAVAADKCDEIVRVDLPAPDTEPDVESGSTPDADAAAPASRTASGTSDEQREARRARRKAQQDEKRKQQESHARAREALRDAKRARTSSTETPTSTAPAQAAAEVHRRDAQLTPEQAAEFDSTDDLIGAVVIALVPFDGDVPAQPGPQQKRRPCIVIGASTSHLLIRPCYSEGGVQSRRWQSHPLRDWVAAGLDRATFVEDEARVIARADAGDPLGRISTEDWNSLW
jgi:hypothetical protein